MLNSYRKAIRFLEQPFPYETTRYGKPRISITVSIFVFLFLVIFQPFGLKYLGAEDLIPRVAEYVAFIFLILCFNFY